MNQITARILVQKAGRTACTNIAGAKWQIAVPF
jgi:hypothetical protein